MIKAGNIGVWRVLRQPGQVLSPIVLDDVDLGGSLVVLVDGHPGKAAEAGFLVGGATQERLAGDAIFLNLGTSREQLIGVLYEVRLVVGNELARRFLAGEVFNKSNEPLVRPDIAAELLDFCGNCRGDIAAV